MTAEDRKCELYKLLASNSIDDVDEKQLKEHISPKALAFVENLVEESSKPIAAKDMVPIAATALAIQRDVLNQWARFFGG